MSTTRINALSRPRGVRYECELCGKEAKLKCNECPTYYCGPEHFDQDWRGIRQHIVEDTALLREKPRTLGSDEERRKREAELIGIRGEVREICSETAQRALVQGEYYLAIPAALQSLKLSIEVHGPESTELVGSYLLLAECNLGLGRLQATEEFLGLGKWILLKSSKDAGVGHLALVSAMQRNFGRLYVAQGKYVEALRAFAEDCHQTSGRFGPSDPRTAPCYFHMGRVFQAMGEELKAKSFYGRVILIYSQWLENAIDNREWLPIALRRSGGLLGRRPVSIDRRYSAYEWMIETSCEGYDRTVVSLSPVELDECLDILGHILNHHQQQQAAGSERESDVARTQYVLSLMKFYTGKDLPMAQKYMVAADEYFQSNEGSTDNLEEMKAKTGHYRILLFDATTPAPLPCES
ncbi:zinc finger, MYND-type containing 12 [Perkinsus chesapeaki]|uniref:Zinc finger, MYND-type containing 12 n=1 Tax=Perkinsus chesapeaki TaxID=330153 RepID=A0A7J6MJ33_PERCH|nr:zinc finger, MYND-type containing 12 [Perkinsus chesapeaki]